MNMRATEWEFRNRAMVFGLIYGASFFLYTVDHENSTTAIANGFVRRWNEQLFHMMGPSSGLDANGVAALMLTPDEVARLLLLIASIVVVAAALIRTWASAYLHAGVVYASQVKSDGLVADGPYRWVRNPLYFGNVLMASGMGAMMSGSGSVLVFVAMVVFCYRLIFREEAELASAQGERYAAFRRAVPRLWPAVLPRIPSAGHTPQWGDGFAAESWNWGFALAVIAFTITLKIVWFFVILGASIALFWVMASRIEKKGSPQRHRDTETQR